MPVNVIMPPASAPKIAWAADVVIGSAVLISEVMVEHGQPDRQRDGHDVGGEDREPHRRAEPDPQSEQTARRRDVVVRVLVAGDGLIA